MIWIVALLVAVAAPSSQEVPVQRDPLRVVDPWPHRLPEPEVEPWTLEAHHQLRDQLFGPVAPPSEEPVLDDEFDDLERWDEIIVWGERVRQARDNIRNKFEAMGYRGKREDGGTRWVPVGKENRWKPRVFIDDDGWYEIDVPTVSYYDLQARDVAQRTPQEIDAPAFQRSPPVYGAATTFRMAGKRTKMQAERRMANTVHPLVSDLRNAIADESTSARLASIADTLEALWYDGAGYYGEFIETRDARIDALLELWSTRTQTHVGEAMRRQIGDFLVEEVLPEHPVDDARIEAAEARCGCALR